MLVRRLASGNLGAFRFSGEDFEPVADMGRWLRSLREEKNTKTAERGTDKAHTTSHEGVLLVLSVPSEGKSDKNSSLAPLPIGQTTDGCVGFVSSPFERFEEIFSTGRTRVRVEGAHEKPKVPTSESWAPSQNLSTFGTFAVVMRERIDARES